jgi:LysR family transcriptional regulator, regulator for metE and metH
MIEIRHLRTLAALHETGSVSLAARRVHLTQSALSHQIRLLQDHYGLPLIQRRGQSVELTDAGHRLVALAEVVLDELQRANRDIARISQQTRGTLRIALECHTCFDWLVPVMNAFRQHWPEIELDLVSGFHSDPLRLLETEEADLIIGSENEPQRNLVHHPLFGFEILAVLPPEHLLAKKKFLKASDFADTTLITYPVPEERIDLIHKVLNPGGVYPERRTTELTVAILQLVASRRGVAALPSWGIQNYLDYGYVTACRIGTAGLWSNLYATTLKTTASRAYLCDFLTTAKNTCFATLKGIIPLE